jgi:hypothetical protein
MSTRRFETVILEGHKGAAAEVPFNPEKAWGIAAVALRPGRKGHRVRGTLNGVPFESCIVPRMRRFWLEIGQELQEQAGVSIGAEVMIAIEPVSSTKS